MLADKGYDSDDVRASLLLKGILPVIPPKANRKEAIACDNRAYKDRNRVERRFNKLKQFRRIATRYDKTAVSFLGFLVLAAAKLWMPSYVNSTYSFRGNSPEGWRIRRLAWIEIWANRWSQVEPVDLLVLYLPSRPFHG